MKKTIRKLFWAWRFEEEENWLNEMSAAGLQLCGVGFCTYHFEEGTPDEYTYRLEMLDKRPSHAKSVQYIHFLEETGAEHICSLLRWVYFRKKSDGGAFDLFSDIDSRISHLNRILLLTGILSAGNLVNSLNMLLMWLRLDTLTNLIAAILCFTVSALLGYGLICTFLKKSKLKKEKLLRE